MGTKSKGKLGKEAEDSEVDNLAPKPVSNDNIIPIDDVKGEDGKIKASITVADVTVAATGAAGNQNYILARLDKSGNEVQGSDFTISQKTFERTYKKLTEGVTPSFIVKKK